MSLKTEKIGSFQSNNPPMSKFSSSCFSSTFSGSGFFSALVAGLSAALEGAWEAVALAIYLNL